MKNIRWLIIPLFLTLGLSSVADAGYPRARQRSAYTAVQAESARIELPPDLVPSDKRVVRLDLEIPPAAVAQRIGERLGRTDVVVLAASDIVRADIGPQLASTATSVRPVLAEAKLVAEDLVEVRYPDSSNVHVVSFRATGVGLHPDTLSKALARLPEVVYKSYDRIEGMVFDGNEYYVLVAGKKVHLGLPTVTIDEQPAEPMWAMQ